MNMNNIQKNKFAVFITLIVAAVLFGMQFFQNTPYQVSASSADVPSNTEQMGSVEGYVVN